MLYEVDLFDSDIERIEEYCRNNFMGPETLISNAVFEYIENHPSRFGNLSKFTNFTDEDD